MKLLNSDSKRSAYTVLAEETTTSNSEITYLTCKKFLIIYRISRGRITNTENQMELPIESLSWLRDFIANGFWRSPSAGGLPKGMHTVSATFDGEEILLGRSMNAGDYGRTGFKIVNKSRKSHIMASRPQEFQITDERVEKVLFPMFDKLGIS